MPMCDYFSAPDDEAAVGVLDQIGGPDASGFDVISLKGIDPSVTMASSKQSSPAAATTKHQHGRAPARFSRRPITRAR